MTLTSIQLTGPGDSSGVLRVVQGIITGIGFLGAGVILHPRNQDNVLGLTTAASIWVVAGLGIGCGAGLWGSTLSAWGLTLLVLALGGRLERFVNRRVAARSDPGDRLRLTRLGLPGRRSLSRIPRIRASMRSASAPCLRSTSAKASRSSVVARPGPWSFRRWRRRAARAPAIRRAHRRSARVGQVVETWPSTA